MALPPRRRDGTFRKRKTKKRAGESQHAANKRRRKAGRIKGDPWGWD